MAEHRRLTASGYVPALVEPDDAAAEEMGLAEVRAKLDAAGIDYDKRLGLGKLRALLP